MYKLPTSVISYYLVIYVMYIFSTDNTRDGGFGRYKNQKVYIILFNGLFLTCQSLLLYKYALHARAPGAPQFTKLDIENFLGYTPPRKSGRARGSGVLIFY